MSIPIVEELKRCLLIIEDDAILLELLRYRLVPQYTVASAGTIRDAVAQLSQRRFDFIVLDKRLPDTVNRSLDGTIQRLRAVAGDAKIVIFSAIADEKMDIRDGADASILKDGELGKLVATLDSFWHVKQEIKTIKRDIETFKAVLTPATGLPKG